MPGVGEASGGAQRLDRRAALACLAASAALLALLAGLLVPWDWVPGGSLPEVAPSEVLDRPELLRAESYAGFARGVGYSAYAASLAVALVLGLTPIGSAVAAAVRARLPRRARWALVPAVTAVLLAAGEVITLPFGLVARDRRLEEGLTTQGLAGWAADRGKSFLVSWVVATLLVALVVGAWRRWPRRWFLPAGLAAAMAVLAGSLLYPVLVEPLFNRFDALPDGPLKASLIDLAERQGVDVDGLLVADASRRTTTLNAYVSGLAATRRVVLYDTLVEGAAPEEVRAVVAHELAHARHDDVLLGTGLGAVGAFAGMTVLALVLDAPRLRRRAGVGDPGHPEVAALVLALVAVGGVVASPVQNTISRAIEARADRTALLATGEPDAFRALQRTLAVRSLADPTPPRLLHVWFGSHPTVLQRFGLVQAVEDTR